MSSQLIIRLPNFSKTASIEALAFDDIVIDCQYVTKNGQLLLENHQITFAEIPDVLDDLSANPEFSSEFSTIVILPAKSVLYTTVEIPPKQQRYIKQALPYLLEETLSEDVEAIHFAIGAQDQGSNVRVVAINKAQLNTWLSWFDSFNLSVKKVVTEYDCLPQTPLPAMLIEQGKIIFRAFEYGSTCTLSMLSVNLSSYIASLRVDVTDPDETDSVKKDNALNLTVYASDAELANTKTQIAECFKAISPEASINPVCIDGSSFAFMCKNVLAKSSSEVVNLLSGAYRVDKEVTVFSTYKKLIVVLMAWFVLQITFNFSYAVYLDKKADKYAAQSKELYGSIFPNERIVSLKRQISNHLKTASVAKGNDFFFIMNKLAVSYDKLADKQLDISYLSYSQQRNEFTLNVKAASFEKLDLYKKQLMEENLNVEIGSITNQDSGAAARVVITWNEG